MKLRCLIIDDEFLARMRLQKLLESYDDLLIVGTCRNGREALELIPLKEPDLIFLDIQMPDLNGFQVLSKLKNKPEVIFTTAYDQYALKAFEINAVDYLLKPFDEERLEIAIKRILDIKKQKKSSILEKKLKSLILLYEQKDDKFLKNIIIHKNGRELPIFVDDIIYFKSEGNYVQLFTEGTTHLLRKTMNALFENLDNLQFLRIHRTLIINKTYIQSSSYIGNNTYKFRLKNGDVLTSSRSFKSTISEFLSHQL